MTERSGVVKGLCDQECEFVPAIDEVQDALNINHKERTQKIKLPNNTEFNATIWHSGTPEEFLNHTKQAVHVCERLGHFETYKKALKDYEKTVRLQAKAVADLEAAKREKLEEGILEGLRTDVATQKAASKEAGEERDRAAEGFFSTYANLLSVEARIAWDNIVARQIGTAPWTDLKGKKHPIAQAKTKKSFDECVTHHLLTVFTIDSAE